MEELSLIESQTKIGMERNIQSECAEEDDEDAKQSRAGRIRTVFGRGFDVGGWMMVCGMNV